MMVYEGEVKVNKWDANAVKNALDDEITKIVKENKDTLVEKTHLIDGRLFISLVSVCFAGFALVWDWLHPFPQSRSVLIGCVVGYFVLMGVLQLYLLVLEKGTFFVAETRDPARKSPDVSWQFSSRMNKYDHMYNLEMQYSSSEASGEGSLSKSIGGWIDENGIIVLSILEQDVLSLYNSLSPERKMK